MKSFKITCVILLFTFQVMGQKLLNNKVIAH